MFRRHVGFHFMKPSRNGTFGHSAICLHTLVYLVSQWILDHIFVHAHWNLLALMCLSDSTQLIISFLKDDPLRSDVVNAASGEKLYSITTEVVGMKRDSTTIRDAEGNIFATWEQKSLGRDQVTFHGARCKLSEWLRRKNIISRSVQQPP